ncbi:kelch-like protein 23 [Bombina bombina]|uniref:kelch-like protein 23 n=1 Tax=Bombina bombina TaxID=8345 RepID=UPI00235A7FB9|nr:kelch-like protein 23 [Bombina bombina]
MEPLSDAVLEVGPRIFHVDRSVLAEQSRYFYVLFYGGFKENTQHRICLKGVAEESFQALLNFTQNGSMNLNRRNVTELLETADFLDLQRAKRFCVGYLEHELRVSNCFDMMSYSKQYDCPDLYDSAFNVALTHFSDILYHEENEFNWLDKETLVELLQSDDLFVSKEDIVFEAVMKWVMVDPDREKYFEELVSLVRPAFLSLSFLDVLVKRSQNPGGQDAYTRLVQTLNTKPPETWSSMDEAISSSRSYETLFVLGGKHEKEQQELYAYLPKTSTWKVCAPLQRKNLTQYAVATVGNLVIVTGGFFRGDFVWYSIDLVAIYDSSLDSWSDGPPMNISRNCHCAVGVGLQLFVMGGTTDEGVTGEVERLDLVEMKWESMSPLMRPVERAAATSLGTYIYVICGRDENGDVYSGIQRLNTEANDWDIVSYSPMPRYDICSTVLNGAIYTIGGQAFRFNLSTEEWSELEAQCLYRKFFMGCSSANGRIYILGQRRARITNDVPSFIQFDPYLDSFKVEDTNLPCPLPIRGCVSMRHCDVC